MNEEVIDYIDILESLVDDLNSKPREELKKIILRLKKDSLQSEDIIKIQEDLEQFTSVFKVDSFTRTEVMNIITDLEMLYNG